MVEKNLKGISFAELIETPVPLIQTWVEPALIPKGGKVLLGAETKAGKSWINLQTCKDIALGRNVFGHPDMKVNGQPRILYVEHEISKNSMHRRISRMFSDLSPAQLEAIRDRLFVVRRDTDIRLDDPLGLQRLWAYVDYYKPNILMLDPVTNMMDGDDNKNIDVANLFNNFDKLLEAYSEYDLSIVVTHHFGKPQSDKNGKVDDLDLYKFRGASTWPGRPDTVFTIARREKFPDKSWIVACRLFLRDAEPLDDFRLHLHAGGKLGVHWLESGPEQGEEEAPPLSPPQPPKSKGPYGHLTQANLFKP